MIANRFLYTHTGKKVHFFDDCVKGKVIGLHLAYTRCTGICPAGLGKVRGLQAMLGDAMGRDVFLYTLTLDPENDTPSVLRKAREEYGAGPGWTFLTGTFEACEDVRRSLGLYDPDPAVDADRSQHSGLMVLGNEPLGRWSVVPLGFRTSQILKSFDRVRLPVDQW